MVDLGLFNFIKNSVAQGKSKEEINAVLSKGGWNQTDIDQAYADVGNGNSPVINKTDVDFSSLRRPDVDNRPTIITVLCGYYFVNWILSLINLLILAISLSKYSNASFMPSLSINSLLGLAIVVSVFGYWNMKKWGVYLYAVSEALSVIYLLTKTTHNFSGNTILILIAGLLLPIVFIYTGFRYLEQMS